MADKEEKRKKSSSYKADKNNPKLEWMYKGSSDLLNREEYLLGRSIDKNFEQLDNEEKRELMVGVQVPKNHVEYECIPFSIREYKRNQTYNNSEQVDLQRKLMEDPLASIKQKEIESRKKILENPVKLKELHRLLKAEADRKRKITRKLKKNGKKKKHSKRESSETNSESNSDLDKKLAVKMKKSGMDKIMTKKYETLTKELGMKHRPTKQNESSEVSESSDEDNDRHHKKHSKKKINKKQISDSSSDSELDEILTKKFKSIKDTASLKQILKESAEKKSKKRERTASSSESESDSNRRDDLLQKNPFRDERRKRMNNRENAGRDERKEDRRDDRRNDRRDDRRTDRREDRGEDRREDGRNDRRQIRKEERKEGRNEERIGERRENFIRDVLRGKANFTRGVNYTRGGGNFSRTGTRGNLRGGARGNFGRGGGSYYRGGGSYNRGGRSNVYQESRRSESRDRGEEKTQLKNERTYLPNRKNKTGYREREIGRRDDYDRRKREESFDDISDRKQYKDKSRDRLRRQGSSNSLEKSHDYEFERPRAPDQKRNISRISKEHVSKKSRTIRDSKNVYDREKSDDRHQRRSSSGGTYDYESSTGKMKRHYHGSKDFDSATYRKQERKSYEDRNNSHLDSNKYTKTKSNKDYKKSLEKTRSNSPLQKTYGRKRSGSSEFQDRKAAKQKLSDEEKEKIRKEMMVHAKERDVERTYKVHKYRKEVEEEEISYKTNKYDKQFANNELKKAFSSSKSIETRIKSNLNNIQRSSKAMDRNFAKK